MRILTALLLLALPLAADDAAEARRYYRRYMSLRGERSQEGQLERGNILRDLGSLQGEEAHRTRLKAMRAARTPNERVLALHYAGPIRDLTHVDHAIRHVQKKKDPVLLVTLGRVLGTTKSAAVRRWVVTRGLVHSDPSVADASCRAVVLLQPPEARAPLLERYAAWADQRTRRDLIHSVVRALGVVDGEGVDETLAAAARHPDERIRLAAADALAGRAGRELLQALLKDKDVVVRRATAQRLGERKREDLVPDLILMLQTDGMRGCRAAACDALQRISGEDFGFEPEAWQAWWRTRSRPDAAPREKTTLAEYYGYRVVSDNAWFLVDVSGSMRHPERRSPNRIEVAREELVGVLAQLDPQTRVNVAVYADKATLWQKRGAVRAELPVLKEAVSWVRTKFHAEGETNLNAALERAFADPGVDTIFLLSDGLPNLGTYYSREVMRDAVAAWNRFRRVRINTIVLTLETTVGRSHAQSAGRAEWLMRRLASDSSGRCTVVKAPPRRR